jgi:hypothetical protein
MSVSGFTIVSRRRQSTNRDKATSMIRAASSARCGLTCRSRYSANCFRRNRFSAASWARDRNADDTTETKSVATQRIVRARMRGRDWLMTLRIVYEHDRQTLSGLGSFDQPRQSSRQNSPGPIFADHRGSGAHAPGCAHPQRRERRSRHFRDQRTHPASSRAATWRSGDGSQGLRLGSAPRGTPYGVP